jgi:hypothetical protein
METLGHETSWVTLDAAAEFLECSAQSVRQWAYNGHLDYRSARSGPMEISETSIFRFEGKFPAAPNGRRGVPRSERVEKGIYKVRVKDGAHYEVKLHRHPGKTFPTLRAARIYRNYLITKATDTAGTQSNGSHSTSWFRLVTRFFSGKSTTA